MCHFFIEKNKNYVKFIFMLSFYIINDLTSDRFTRDIPLNFLYVFLISPILVILSIPELMIVAATR